MMTKISNTLKKRLITAFILAPIILAITFWAPTKIFALLLLVFTALSAYEWAKLSGVQNNVAIAGFVLLLSVAFLYLYKNYNMPELKWLFYCSGLWWLYILLRFKIYKPRENKKFSAVKLAQGIVTIVPAVLAVYYLHDLYGALMVFYVFAIVWGADVGAYFSGKKFGKRKLAPTLSPGKTIEGVIGGLLVVLVLALCVGSVSSYSSSELVIFISISLLVALFSVVGDLYESLLKREAAVKDSSRLLPGHGGVLDRIDSLLAAAPLFLILYIILF